jgi:exopolysaccharide biosynthesis WecB/TagA/CpsF family protein/anti-anti-sigma factor
MEEVVDRIAGLIARRAPRYLITANLDFATLAAEDLELQRIFVEAELVVCDGTPLVWASRLAGRPLRERVAGSDLVPRLAEEGRRRGWKIFLLGGDPGSLERAQANMAERYPGLAVTGYSPPFARFHDMDHAEIADRIRAAAPDLLFVAFGCPKQEKWIYAHYRELGVPVSIGVGATVDFLAGKVRRAPSWLGRLGLEWVFRLAQEPRRLAGRYARNLKFLAAQLFREREVVFSRPSPAAPDGVGAERENGGVTVIRWTGALVAANCGALEQPPAGRPFVVDLAAVTQIDSTGLGALLGLIRRGWASGGPGVLCAPSEPVRRLLAVTRLERVLPIAPDLAAAHQRLSAETVRGALRPVTDAAEASIHFALPANVVGDNAAALGAAVAAEWEAHPAARELQLDFGATRFMDSTGLGFVLRCRKLVDARPGAKLTFHHLPDAVRNVIRVSRLEQVLGLPPA